MYLSDGDIRSRLGDLNLECSDPKYPFSPDEQIQPCSIDLRLSTVFWECVPRKAIDLRRTGLLDLAPRRYWKKRVLAPGEYITLYPGRLLLACVYEKFSIPTDCAGKIEGRSSFARLGLGIHCSADFLNPGYRGHMPLQLVNCSPNQIRIFPYIPICQLVLVRLSSPPSRVYGLDALQSKYMDDDGGPSYWWRDKRIKELQNVFRQADVSIAIQERLLGEIGVQEPEVIERFEVHVESTSRETLASAEALLDSFCASEDRLRRRDSLVRGAACAAFPVLASVAGGSLFAQPFSWLHYAIWCTTLGSLAPFVWGVRETPKQYFGDSERRVVPRP